MFGKVITIVTVCAGIALLLLLSTTTPSTAGPAGILAVFFLLYVFLIGCITGVLRITSQVVSKMAKPLASRRPVRVFSLKHSYYLSTFVALGPVLLLGMSSVGKTGIYEFLLVVLFVVIGVFYIEKRA